MTQATPGGQKPRMSADYVKRAITPLRLFFWGALLCVFNFGPFFTTNKGAVIRVDILNDVIGMILIAGAVFALARIPVRLRYRVAMMFVQLVALLSVVDVAIPQLADFVALFAGPFVIKLPPAVGLALKILSAGRLVALIVFCIAMRWFCLEAGLAKAAESWKLTGALFFVICLYPLGIASFVDLMSLDLPPVLVQMLVAVMAVPVVHLFISTSIMKRGARKMSLPAPEPAQQRATM